MKNKINTTIVLITLLFIALGCNASFTTANISSFNFGKNETATPPTTSFDVGEKVYAVANVSNSASKQKIKFTLIFEKVEGKGKGEVAATKELELPGSASANFFFTPPLPGDYKVEAALIDDQGKEIDKKSGTVSVKGGAPAQKTSTETKKDNSADDSDDDSKDK